MILGEDKREQFEEACKPLVEFLNDNCHPHVTVVVTPSSAELSEGVCHVLIQEFIKD